MLKEFFNDLLDEIQKLRIEIGPTAALTAKELNSAEQHIKMLLLYLERSPSQRVKSVVKSSWAYVNKTGKTLRLFDKYKGNEALRAELIKFLDSGY